ncbi:MAG: response regulator [Chloroflexota bacterium]
MPQPPEARPALPHPLAQIEILIVDDTLPNLQLLSAMLRRQGYGVREAADGIQALQAANQFSPELILLDIRMPGMDGYEVCRRLKSDPRLQPVPVIFVSALDDQMDKVQGFAAGGVDYITKPFQVKEVLARVETHLTLRLLQRQLSEQNDRLQQEVAERLHFETALQQANEALEQRVAERTAALLQANLELSGELQERRRVEKERELLLAQVRSQERQLSEIMNTVPEGVLLLDSAGRVILANPAARLHLQALGAADEDRPLARLGERPLAELLNSPPPGLWHEVKSGLHIFEVIARPMDEDAGPHHWVMVLREVTQEREVQRHMQQQDRLAAVGQMAAGIAHDFNNILAVILLYTEMVLNTPDLSSKTNERLQTVAQQARRASDLIQQILDFSRRSVLERRPMELLPFIKEQVKLLERTLPENIHIQLQAQDPAYAIEADPTRLQQLVMNLCVNARDAMPDGGQLQVRVYRPQAGEPVQCVTCGDVDQGAWVCLEVADSGVGIAAQDLPRIFEPFFTTKEPGKGTGLGLSQVYGIVKSHSGHLNVRSQPGLGAVFSLYFPLLATGGGEDVDDAGGSLVRGQGQHILVVEDETITRQALVDTLSLINYQVTALSNGQQALDLLKANPQAVDLVLSDVVMPELGGISLLRLLRQMGLEIPVILMTGHPLQEDVDKLRSYGLTAWLPKPPRVKHLARVIAGALK